MANKFSDLVDITAEENLLSAIFVKNEVLADVKVCEQDFARASNAVIFKTMKEMYSENVAIDAVTVVNRLNDTGRMESAGGIEQVTKILMLVPTAAGLPQYQEIIRNFSQRRQIHRICRDVAGEAIDGNKEITEIINGAMVKFNGIGISEESADTTFVSGKDIMIATYDSIYDPQRTGIKTGFRDLDTKLSYGMRPGELIVLAGRPSMGKTALALNIVTNVLRQGKKVLIFSLETGVESVGTRLIQSLANISQQEIVDINSNDKAGDRLIKAANWFTKHEKDLMVNTSGYHTVDTIKALCRRARLKNGLDMVVIDHAQLISAVGFKNNRVAEMSYISRMLKTMAKELDVPIFLLSQLNRSVESREDKRPRMSDLRESGSIEQDADVIMLIYRDAYYHPEDNSNTVEVNVAKQKDGATGTVPLRYAKEFMRFSDAPIEDTFGKTVKDKEVPM